MKPKKGFLKKDTQKPKLGYAGKSGDAITGNDLRELKKTLGEFDPHMPITDLHKRLIRSRRYSASEAPLENRILVKSASGYAGRHSGLSLHQLCHGSS